MLSNINRYWIVWDRFISTVTFKILQDIGWNVRPTSTVTSQWIAVESPTILMSCLIVYLVVVSTGCAKLRRQSKTSKEPSWLKSIVVFHNLFLILLSAYMCLGCVAEAYSNGYTIWGNNYKPSEIKMARLIYTFYVSKIYEFIDTFIMLLKGNLKQVSFLHIYHHATISFIWWMIVRVAPGGDAYFSAALNSWVHVCMYSYYLLAIVIGKSELKRQKYLWWGRYLTQMQMFQFVLNLCQALYCSKYSPYPKFLSKILLVYMASLLALFGHFYYSKHIVTVKNLSKKLP
jgi:elongation of very long chain fatty acids protein 4